MNKIESDLVNEYIVIFEYYLFSTVTFGERSDYAVQFKKESEIIKTKILGLNFDFYFENVDQMVPIDYRVFEKNIESIIMSDWREISAEEFNCLMHLITGVAVQLYTFYDNWQRKNRDLFMEIYGDQYLKMRRKLIID